MSLANVEAFYKRLSTDEAFRSRIQQVNSKDECSQIVKAAGYDFTPEEFEEYTAQLLESDGADGELRELDEKELEVVFGGKSFLFIPKYPYDYLMYGGVTPPESWIQSQNFYE
ncbi:Nif11-like leader peptide family natural product precursor [Microseira sp. BLCC-F43]|jgi:predicted ribosomally synthesized peptide with nif11-like leader|uniref:Nif11-like leader peptide family natural product precursor n=1 Tax=Microseira sp. BLCC-F43 TaxID=3153602 RepID=UPI0035B8DDEA